MLGISSCKLEKWLGACIVFLILPFRYYRLRHGITLNPVREIHPDYHSLQLADFYHFEKIPGSERPYFDAGVCQRQRAHAAVQRELRGRRTRRAAQTIRLHRALRSRCSYSRAYLQRRDMMRGEYYVLALTALLGIFVLVSANSLLTVYIGIELMSLSLYAMVAFERENGVAAESAMKYFLLGAIASGMLLYGMSLIYGMTGTLMLDDLSAMAAGNPASASCWVSCSSSSQSRSSSARCRSTCGCPTCTPARPRA